MLSHSRLQTIILTSRLAEAERFYTEVLGLELRRRLNGHLLYDVGGSDLTLGSVPSTHPLDHTVAGFAVDDLDAVMTALSNRGLSWARFDGINHDEHGVLRRPNGDRVAWFRDPDGNILSIVQYCS
jgi:catechol 2,3-dioxygenase-like lactoylglutathione lyase family enzyme